MKVFRVQQDVDHFQFAVPISDDGWVKLQTDGTSLKDKWDLTHLRIFNIDGLRGDFFSFNSDNIIASKYATDLLLPSLQRCEILPICIGNTEYCFINLIDVCDCLDSERSKWVYGATTGQKIDIDRYEFYIKKLPSVGLFKLPETRRKEILILESNNFKKDEFRNIYNTSKLTGLTFQLIWETDNTQY